MNTDGDPRLNRTSQSCLNSGENGDVPTRKLPFRDDEVLSASLLNYSLKLAACAPAAAGLFRPRWLRDTPVNEVSVRDGELRVKDYFACLPSGIVVHIENGAFSYNERQLVIDGDGDVHEEDGAAAGFVLATCTAAREDPRKETLVATCDATEDLARLFRKARQISRRLCGDLENSPRLLSLATAFRRVSELEHDAVLYRGLRVLGEVVFSVDCLNLGRGGVLSDVSTAFACADMDSVGSPSELIRHGAAKGQLSAWCDAFDGPQVMGPILNPQFYTEGDQT